MEAFNILLDPLPDAYDGHKINSDFRIGIQIALASKDEELADFERLYVMTELLYKDGAPKDIENALRGVKWFMSGGKIAEGLNGAEEAAEEVEEGEGADTFDFNYDAARIYSAFRKTYGINLNTVQGLHWFEFLALLGDLGDCAFSAVIGYRTKSLDGLPPKQRSEYAKLKQKYALPRRLNDEEEERLAAFEAALATANSKG